MKDITLTLNNTTLVIQARDYEGATYYKAQDMLRGYFQDSKNMNDTMRAWTKRIKFTLNLINEDGKLLVDAEESSKVLARNGLLTVKGNRGGTYLTRRNLLKLAGYVSSEFEDAVYAAFESLMDGDTASALSIAQSVAKVQRDVAKLSFRTMTDAIQEKFGDNPFVYSNFSKLVFRVATGYDLKDIQGEKLKGEGNRDYLVRMGDVQAVCNLDKSQIQVTTMIDLGMDFQQIKNYFIKP